jgi:hypothetical protein
MVAFAPMVELAAAEVPAGTLAAEPTRARSQVFVQRSALPAAAAGAAPHTDAGVLDEF